MSNASLAHRLVQSIGEFRAGHLRLDDLANLVESHAGCFEGLAFQDYKRFQSLAQSLQVLAWYAGEGCPDETEVERQITELREVLSAVPQL